jgi:hypothetical protein
MGVDAADAEEEEVGLVVGLTAAGGSDMERRRPASTPGRAREGVREFGVCV